MSKSLLLTDMIQEAQARTQERLKKFKLELAELFKAHGFSALADVTLSDCDDEPMVTIELLEYNSALVNAFLDYIEYSRDLETRVQKHELSQIRKENQRPV